MYRLRFAVTAIKNQGQCGSCWAFSATEAVESQLVLTSGSKLRIELSPQQITSCTPSPCQGCNGGFTEDAYDYLFLYDGDSERADLLGQIDCCPTVGAKNSPFLEFILTRVPSS